MRTRLDVVSQAAIVHADRESQRCLAIVVALAGAAVDAALSTILNRTAKQKLLGSSSLQQHRVSDQASCTVDEDAADHQQGSC